MRNRIYRYIARACGGLIGGAVVGIPLGKYFFVVADPQNGSMEAFFGAAIATALMSGYLSGKLMNRIKRKARATVIALPFLLYSCLGIYTGIDNGTFPEPTAHLNSERISVGWETCYSMPNPNLITPRDPSSEVGTISNEIGLFRPLNIDPEGIEYSILGIPLSKNIRLGIAKIKVNETVTFFND